MAIVIAIILVVGTVNYTRESREPRAMPSPSQMLPDTPRAQPQLDPERRVNEVDCTRPIDPSAGNIRCK